MDQSLLANNYTNVVHCGGLNEASVRKIGGRG